MTVGVWVYARTFPPTREPHLGNNVSGGDTNISWVRGLSFHSEFLRRVTEDVVRALSRRTGKEYPHPHFNSSYTCWGVTRVRVRGIT